VHTAFVLAAGFGTRLRPLTEVLPKPLVPVCGVPILSYALAGCARHGLDRVVVNAHHLADALASWEGEREGVRITLSVESPEILGTGGGLRQVRHLLAERFVVVNGDVLNDVDLAGLLAEVPEGGAAMALRPHPDAARYGVVAADATGTVVRLASVAEAEPEGPVDEGTHFTGVHAMHRDALDRVPDGFACIVRTAYKQLVPKRRVRGLRHEGLWLDVGDPAAYLEANLAALRGLALPLDPFARAAWWRSEGRSGGDPGWVAHAEVVGSAWVGEMACVGRALVEDCVIGAGAAVAHGASIRRCVVWDEAEVPAGDWSDTIFYGEGTFHVEHRAES